MKKNVRLVLLFALIAVMLVMTAVFASAATTDVAAGGDLAGAISSAAPGDTINITGDVTVAQGIYLDKNITINGNGNKITFSAVSNINANGSLAEMRSGHGVIGYAFNLAGGTVTIQNATVVVPNDDTSKAAVFFVSGASTTTISGVTTDGGWMTVAYNAAGTVNVNNSTLGANSGHQYVLASSAAAANATFSMTGGTVSHTTDGALRAGGDMIAFAGYVNFSADGTTFASKGDTLFFPGGVNLSLKNSTVNSASGNAIAIAGNANNVVLIDGGSVSCANGCRALDVDGGTATVKNVTSWHGTFRIQSSGTLTVKSGNFGTGTLSHAGRANAEILFHMNTAGTLNIEDGTFTTNSGDSTSCILWANDGNANVNVTGGTFTVNGKGIPIRICNAKTLTLSGAKIVNKDTSTYALQIMNCQSTYTLYDLEIEGGGVAVRLEKSMDITISHVTISGAASYAFNPSNGTNGCTMKLYDCNFTTGGSAAINAAGATLEIYSGTYTATGDKNIIRMGDNDICSPVKIYGGTFKTENASAISFSHSAKNADDYPGSLLISNEKGTVPKFESTGSGSILFFGSTKTTAMPVVIKGGEFTANNSGNMIDFSGSAPLVTLEITGGTFTQNGDGSCLALRNASRFMSTVKISGGTFVSGNVVLSAQGAPIELSGSVFMTTSGWGVINMGDNDVTSDVTIKGGTYTATGTGAIIRLTHDQYAKKDFADVNDPSAYVANTNCMLGDVVIENGTFTVDQGAVIYYTSIKTVPANVTIKDGSFTSSGDAVIVVAKSDATSALTIEGGRFTLLGEAEGASVIKLISITRENAYATGEQEEVDGEMVDVYADYTYFAGCAVNINGGMFIDSTTTGTAVIDASLAGVTSAVTLGDIIVLNKSGNGYFYATGDAATSVAVSANSPTVKYNSASHYIWMTLAGEADAELDNGASVRVDATAEMTGIRFTGSAKYVEGATYGILIAPADYVAAAGAFTKEALDTWAAAKSIAVPYVMAVAQKSLHDNGDGTVSFSVALVDIQSGNYGRSFAAVPYVTVGGETTYGDYDSTNNARSMKSVATEALADLLTDAELSELVNTDADKAAKYIYTITIGGVEYASKYSADDRTALEKYTA